MLPGSPEYARLLAPFTDGTPALRDAWHLAHPGRPHAPTVGLHNDATDAGMPFTFDFAFVSTDLAGRVRRLQVDGAATGSDHQPLLLELAWGRYRQAARRAARMAVLPAIAVLKEPI
jgi:endonuclease/exonuclease/phosphatase family metal-dependent hydrolase